MRFIVFSYLNIQRVTGLTSTNVFETFEQTRMTCEVDPGDVVLVIDEFTPSSYPLATGA